MNLCIAEIALRSGTGEHMKSRIKTVGRKAWSKPEVRTLAAGSAETGSSGSPDGGPGGNNKS